MSRGTHTRYPARRSRRRRRRISAALVAVFFVCVAAYAFVSFGGTTPTASNQSRDESPVTNTVETSSVETSVVEGTTGGSPAQEKGGDPLPPPEKSCDDPRVLVGKRNPLPPTYEPMDLTSLAAFGVPTYGGDQFVRRGTLDPLARLVSEAASEGHELVVLSAYRSYAKQEQNFAHFTGIYGDDAEIVSAPPGQSQHQLGTTVDFTNAEVGYQLLPSFGETPASEWLEENAWRHGFVITYPDGDEQGTGRQHEPWEYRHVGRKLARQVHESDMSLREFLTEVGVRPRC